MKNQRILSVDALRGFDMLWIIGADAVIKGLAEVCKCPVFNFLANQMEHVSWAGFHFYDNIFPLFLFLAGMSLPFSLLKRKNEGQKTIKIYLHILKRVVILVLFGFLVNGMLSSEWNGFENVRYASVLGRIGIAWGIAAVLLLHFDWKKIIGICLSILIGYWVLLRFVPVPGFGANNFSIEGNWGAFIDHRLLPGITYLNQPLDPEGIVSTIPAIATALLGALTGMFLKSAQRFSANIKALIIFSTGAVLMGLGYLWSFDFPVIKALWTSSFVLVSVGFSLLLFSIFYYVIDVLGYSKWAFPLKVIGMNSITIYLCAQGAVNFWSTRDFFFNAFLSVMPQNYQLLTGSILVLIMEWIFLYVLYKKNIFLKV